MFPTGRPFRSAGASNGTFPSSCWKLACNKLQKRAAVALKEFHSSKYHEVDLPTAFIFERIYKYLFYESMFEIKSKLLDFIFGYRWNYSNVNRFWIRMQRNFKTWRLNRVLNTFWLVTLDGLSYFSI